VTATASATPTVPLQLGAAQFSLFTINPQFTKQTVSFTLSTAAQVGIRIAPTGQTDYVRTVDLGTQPAGTVSFSWDGRDNAHRAVPEGAYSYTITATGAGGQRQSETYSMLGVTYKRIVVSLSKQQLSAYDGTQLFLSTLVTTGNAALPTPLGQFPILARYSPFTMVSPWPVGSPFYYAPSYVNYALLFDNRGYYVHDASWRSNFGPGSNAVAGTPGQNDTGTHGCVNVPFTTMQQLFAWATIGTVVDVVP
jgi:lipoprotein-anchoring transpeptidase ErfK/SrfK